MSQIDNLLHPSGGFQGLLVSLTLIVLSPVLLFFLKGPAPGASGVRGIAQKRAASSPGGSKRVGKERHPGSRTAGSCEEMGLRYQRKRKGK